MGKRTGAPGMRKYSTAASKTGRLEVLKWARENGCPWNGSACAGAAQQGHLEVLKWLRERLSLGCCHLCTRSQGGHLEVLKWAIEQGCPAPNKALCGRTDDDDSKRVSQRLAQPLRRERHERRMDVRPKNEIPEFPCLVGQE